MKTHISLNVSNIEKSVEFYERMLGSAPVKVKPGYAKFDVANPPLNLSMVQSDIPKGGSLSHLGIQVDSSENVSEVAQRWAGAGLATLDEMKTDCCYALQDKVWVSDPDGNRWEVFTVLKNTGGENDTATCCAPAEKTVSIEASNKGVCSV